MINHSNDSYKMKNLIDISAMVTESVDFFEIKDKIIEKMIEVVHPTKACVNLFYKNNYDHAYLVCAKTLDYIPQVFPINSPRGIRIDFNEYPKYIHQAVREKRKIYIENVFEDERAIEERELAKEEGYQGRIVFPFIINNTVVGFMTCFLTESDYVTEKDIDFMSSVASLISLSIDISTKNNNTQLLVHKLRGAIASINEATKKLYLNKNINGFLEHLSRQACNITKSKECIIVINEQETTKKVLSFYNAEDKNNISIYPIVKDVLKTESTGEYYNNINLELKDGDKAQSYIYYKLKNKDKTMGCIVCANSQNYTSDDLNILSILAKQVSVAMQLYKYNVEEVKHKVLANELNVLSQQQKLIMDKGNMECNNQKELSYYHKPARVVGGDFYYAMKVDEENIVYILADVMGHGIVSNYVVAMIKGAFKVLCHQYKTPGEIMTNLNKILYDEFDKMGVFTTCLISMVNTKENTITVSNAGHYSPIMINNKGLKVSDLNCIKGLPIGIMEDAEYVNNTHDINEYSIVCMYTDGILEIKNEIKEEYGISKLEKFLETNFRLSQQSLFEKLKIDLKEFSQKQQYEDDILIVMLKDK